MVKKTRLFSTIYFYLEFSAWEIFGVLLNEREKKKKKCFVVVIFNVGEGLVRSLEKAV